MDRTGAPAAHRVIGLTGILLLGLLASSSAIGASDALTDPAQPPRIRLDKVSDRFDHPVLLVGAGDGTGDRYVVEQRGSIGRFGPDGSKAATSFLDISDHVHYQHERGMLGLAFHPGFSENGRLFVTYTRRGDSATVLSEFTVPDPAVEPIGGEQTELPMTIEQSERTLLVLAQPLHFHKGGMLVFDDEGMLLMSVGDGGGDGDPGRHGLDSSSMLGKLLRLDVDSGWPYGLPPDNGFAGVPGAHPEIHAIGLRNPWRFSIDRATGHLFIGDVGQSGWEEVDVLPPGTTRASFGWSDMEGPGCLRGRACDPSAHLLPAYAYPHAGDDAAYCAIVGGYVYRGGAGSLPDGLYLFGDYCDGTIWGVPAADLIDGTATPTAIGRLDAQFGQILSFGEDDAGELYVMGHAGDIFHIVADDGSADVV